MIHPSYVELMDVVNHEVEKTGEDPVVNSRYSIVCATAKRAREIIDGDEPLVRERSNKPLSVAVDELYSGELKILTEDEVKDGEDVRSVYEEKLSELRELRRELDGLQRSRREEEIAARQALMAAQRSEEEPDEDAAADEEMEDELSEEEFAGDEMADEDLAGEDEAEDE